MSLRDDLGDAGFDSNGTDDFYMVYPDVYDVSQQDIAIGNTSPGAIQKTIKFIGQGEGTTVISGARQHASSSSAAGTRVRISR